MNLLKSIAIAKIPAMGSTENTPLEQVLLYVKFFDPCGRGTWYVAEYDGKDQCFGFCISPLGEDCDEWGYFSIAELQSVKGRFGLGIERDLHFRPVAFGELLAVLGKVG